MIKLAFKTNKNKEEILDKAVKYFKEIENLEVKERGTCCLIMGEMYRDYVMVTLSQEEKDILEVTVESREHEYHVKKFIEENKYQNWLN